MPVILHSVHCLKPIGDFSLLNFDHRSVILIIIIIKIVHGVQKDTIRQKKGQNNHFARQVTTSARFGDNTTSGRF